MLRRTLAAKATLDKIAKMGNIDVEVLIQKIEEEIQRRKGGSKEDRKEILKGIIRDLHAGVDMEILRRRFADLVRNVSPAEIAEVEQSLIDEGLPESEVKRLCDVHVEVFRHSLDEDAPPLPPAGHPVHTFIVENRASENIVNDIESLIREIGHPPDKLLFNERKDTLGVLVEKLSEIDKHYLRKENQLFPRLEARDMSGPSQVMWAIHDDVRDALKKTKTQISEGDLKATQTLDALIKTIRDMIYKEEKILYPMSMETLTLQDWLQVKKGEEEIGYAWIEPLVDWSPELEKGSKIPKIEPTMEVFKNVDLDVGSLSPEQINLLLTHLPIDVTFVDENDRVAYYSQGKERIFPRSPGIIGRTVQKCHPPKSVHIVEKILNELKTGKKDSAEFWIQIAGRCINIRYFAVRDSKGTYRGTLEVSQDITEIREIEGEKRILDWKD